MPFTILSQLDKSSPNFRIISLPDSAAHLQQTTYLISHHSLNGYAVLVPVSCTWLQGWNIRDTEYQGHI